MISVRVMSLVAMVSKLRLVVRRMVLHRIAMVLILLVMLLVRGMGGVLVVRVNSRFMRDGVPVLLFTL